MKDETKAAVIDAYMKFKEAMTAVDKAQNMLLEEMRWEENDAAKDLAYGLAVMVATAFDQCNRGGALTMPRNYLYSAAKQCGWKEV